MLRTEVTETFIAPSNQRKKSEIRISKSETNSETNKSQIGKIQNTESAGSPFGICLILVISNRFEFCPPAWGRDFVLRIFCSWRPLRPFGVTQGMLCGSHFFSDSQKEPRPLLTEARRRIDRTFPERFFSARHWSRQPRESPSSIHRAGRRR